MDWSIVCLITKVKKLFKTWNKWVYELIYCLSEFDLTYYKVDELSSSLNLSCLHDLRVWFKSLFAWIFPTLPYWRIKIHMKSHVKRRLDFCWAFYVSILYKRNVTILIAIGCDVTYRRRHHGDASSASLIANGYAAA